MLWARHVRETELDPLGKKHRPAYFSAGLESGPTLRNRHLSLNLALVPGQPFCRVPGQTSWPRVLYPLLAGLLPTTGLFSRAYNEYITGTYLSGGGRQD